MGKQGTRKFKGIPIEALNGKLGNVFYVGNAEADYSDDPYYGLNPNKPFATLDYAIGKCVAGDDAIVVMAGHSEELATAGAVTCDIAGVDIIGLGRKGQRPVFSLTATDSSILVTAADVGMKNLAFSSGIAELVTCIAVTGAGFTMDECAVLPTATSMINFISFATAANYGSILNCDFCTTAIPTANDYFVHGIGNDNMVIRNNRFQVLTSNHSGSGSILTDGTLTANMEISENYIYSIGTSVIAIRLLTGSTGMMWNNQIGTTKTDADNVVVSDGTFKFNNLTTNNLDASGFVAPAIDTAG